MNPIIRPLKTYQKGGNPKFIKDWVDVPRQIRAKLVEEILPNEFFKKLEYLKLTDEIFNGHNYIPNENVYKERLEHYLKKYPTFEEFIFETCHWNNVVYNVNYKNEQDTNKIYLNDFQYLYYAIFRQKFPIQLYENWSNQIENENKFLSDFVREIKFGKNKNKVQIETSDNSFINDNEKINNFLKEFDFDKVNNELKYYDYLISISDFNNEFLINFDYKFAEDQLRYYDHIVNSEIDKELKESFEAEIRNRKHRQSSRFYDDTDYTYYNDDKDMDQQSEEFWNQF